MPQPIKKLPENWIRGERALAENPELAINIAVICAIWSEVETHFAMIAAWVLGGHSSVATRMFLALSGSSSRNAVIRAAASHMLPVDFQKQVSELITEIGVRQKERNGIVHATWAYSAKHPKILIRIDGHEEAAMYADVAAAIFGAPITGKIRLSESAKAPRMAGYNQKDFRQIIDRINALHMKTMRLWADLSEFRTKEWHAYARRESGPAFYPTPPQAPEGND